MIVSCLGSAYAHEFSLSGGQAYSRWTFQDGKMDSTTYRVGYISPSVSQWDFDGFRLKVELETGVHFWQDDWTDEDKVGAYLNPMWRLYFPTNNTDWYIGLGVGVAYTDGDELLDRQLGSKLLFEDRFEIGSILDRKHRISLSVNHYSNANLADINHGVNLYHVNYAYKF